MVNWMDYYLGTDSIVRSQLISDTFNSPFENTKQGTRQDETFHSFQDKTILFTLLFRLHGNTPRTLTCILYSEQAKRIPL
jgi:hypothetical protein